MENQNTPESTVPVYCGPCGTHHPSQHYHETAPYPMGKTRAELAADDDEGL